MIQNSFEREFEVKRIKEKEMDKIVRQNSSMKDYKILQQKMILRRL